MRHPLYDSLAFGMCVLNDLQSSPVCGTLYVLPETKVGGVMTTSSLQAGTVQAQGGLLSHTASPGQDQGQRQFPTEQTGAKVAECCLPRRSVSVVRVV